MRSGDDDYIVAVNVLMLVIWLLIVFFIVRKMHRASMLMLVILSAPFLIGIMNILFLQHVDYEVKKAMFHASPVSELLVVLGLFIGLSGATQKALKNKNGDWQLFTYLIVMALLLALVSEFDVWIPKEWLRAFLYMRTLASAQSATLLFASIYLILIDLPTKPEESDVESRVFRPRGPVEVILD
jgi:MFS family permease